MVWAARILPVEEILAEVKISNGDGTFSVAEISKNLDAKHQNIQYNVHKLIDLVNRVGAAEHLIPMTPPVEPRAPDDIEHEIQHNVHTAYEALREHYERKLTLDKE